MQNFHHIPKGTVVWNQQQDMTEITTEIWSLWYQTKTLKVSPCIYGKISFSLAVGIYIILFINEPLSMAVKYNVANKIHKMIHRKSRITRKEPNKWITETCY